MSRQVQGAEAQAESSTGNGAEGQTRELREPEWRLWP